MFVLHYNQSINIVALSRGGLKYYHSEKHDQDIKRGLRVEV